MTGWKLSNPLAGLLGAVALLLGGCGLPVEADYPNEVRGGASKGEIVYDSELKKRGDDSIFGDGGLTLFGGGDKKRTEQGGPGIAVNSFLWRASLDTIAFMPLSSADPFGGVIITDWYTPPEAPRERYKMSVYILGRELRADGVKVAVFRESANGADGWIASAVSKDTAANLENQILTRARQLRLASAQAQ
jgi:hypothetical protein